jgi:hypothetical protein
LVPVFMFCAPGLIFYDTEGVGSCFHVLCSQTHFRRFRGRRVLFSCFALPDSLSALPSASGPAFIFCSLGLVFGDAECVGSRFHIFRARTRFRRYRGHQVPFSCFALPYSLSTLPSASGLDFIFCTPGLVFGGAECVGSHFHVLRARTRFRRYRGPRVPISCFALPDSFSTVPRASDLVFMFYAPGLIFDGTEGIRSRFYVLRSQTRCRRCRVRRVSFSCFVLPNSFSAVPRP